MKAFTAALLVGLVSLPAPGGAGKPPASPAAELTQEHWNAGRTFRVLTPEGWTVSSVPGQPETTEARGEGLLVRILRRDTELGLDSLHVECMLVRLRPAMETFPQVDYEYDFVGGAVGDRRALDSAFVVHYDEPVDGARDWRQRNLTVVGGGESLCVITYAPLPVWKKSKAARKLLTAIVESVRF